MSASAAPAPGEHLMVADMFGPTLQGEGPTLGRRACFVRLSGCHLSCSWCDTPETWDTTRFELTNQRTEMSPRHVVDWVDGQTSDTVVITGGEPLLQQAGVSEVAGLLHARGHRIEIETSGTVVPWPGLVEVVTVFNVSPKLANSGLHPRRRIRASALRALGATGKAVFKFVVTDPADLDEITALEHAHGLAPIWVMPEGRTAEEVLARMRLLADPVIARGWNLTTRLHILLWGNVRGR
jgi:7-cyano-7-deazaguanosine (preQ0) biosynthesis protein QueE